MEVSNRIRSLYEKPSVFQNKELLKKGHHPSSLDDVLHRDKIIDEYITILKEVIDGEVPDNLFIYGTFGTGKTMLTKLSTSELALAAEQAGNKVTVVYIYCETFSAPSPLIQYINQSLIDSMHGVKKPVGISKAKNFEYFCELVDEINGPVILIFDEIDKLKEPDIINQISRIKECGFTKNNVCIIGITNDTHFYDGLDDRTKSVIGQNELFIPPYDAIELNDILKSRANAAFVPGALSEVVIPLCAAFGAQENGDARTAIDILKTSGDLADSRSSSIIEEIDVRNAKEKMELNRQLEVVGRLPDQTISVLLACVYGYEQKRKEANLKSLSKITHGVESKIVYLIYEKICNIIALEPVKPRRVNDYLGELDTLGIISVTKESRGRRKGVFNSVKPLVEINSLQNIVFQNARFCLLKELSENGGMSRLTKFV